MRYYVTLGAREIPVDVTALPGGGWEVHASGSLVEVEALPLEGALSLRIDGQVVNLVVEGSSPELRFHTLGTEGGAIVESERSRARASARGGGAARAKGHVIAPMPGRVVRVLVAAGDEVAAGAPLVVIEAMKMENELRASFAARVSEVRVVAGDTVEGGTELIRLE